MCDPVSETYDFILDCVDKHAEVRVKGWIDAGD